MFRSTSTKYLAIIFLPQLVHATILLKYC